MRTRVARPSISAGVNTKRRTAASAAASKAGLADSCTATSSTVPSAAMVTARTTEPTLPASSGGKSASTKVTSSGGRVSAPACWVGVEGGASAWAANARRNNIKV